MSFTQSQIDAMKDAIAKGTRRVKYDDKEIEYSSLSELINALVFMEWSNSGKSFISQRPTFSKGLCPPIPAANGSSFNPISGPPTGIAGGDLFGFYPNPEVQDDSHSHTKSTLQLPGVIVEFDYQDTPSLIIQQITPGDIIKEIVLEIEEPFDPGFIITLGFPADNSELIKSTEIDSMVVSSYKFYPYKEAQLTQTLTLYLTGISSQGFGRLYIDDL